MPSPAIEQPVYKPAMRVIANMVPQGENTLITTTFPHSYLVDLIVSLFIPQGYGMVRANGMTGRVIAVTDDTLLVKIDTRDMDAFVTPVPQLQYAQVLPVGEVTEQFNSALVNVLPYN